MDSIPTKFAVVRVGWGSEKKHLYSMSDWDVGYYKSENDAREAARKMILEESATMVALLEVKAVLVQSLDVAELS